MFKPVMLDTCILGKIAHPHPNKDIAMWLQDLIRNDFAVIIPEIVDYELRRSLLYRELTKSIQRLNDLKEELIYLPLNTETMLIASELWAKARKIGKPTAGPKELDCDIILSAQALYVNAIIATENLTHFIFVEAKSWDRIK